MKVKDLIALLEECDPEAECLLAVQPHYPFECGVRSVAVRSSYDEEFQELEPQPECQNPNDDRRPNDVLICQGSQLRYGSRDAWEA